MLKDKLWLDLQLFADGDGGDGGDGGAASPEGGQLPGEDENLSRIPERGRKLYKEVAAEMQKKAQAEKTFAEQKAPQEELKHIPITDLIKSDEYKEEFQAFMDKTISDRFKKYKGVEDENTKMSNMLSSVAVRYGLDPSSPSYYDDLSEAISNDSSYLESYAMENDLSPEEAAKDIEMKRKISAYEAEKKEQENERIRQEQIQKLLNGAEQTKSLYSDFDLEAEMENEVFRNVCAATQGNTTLAYRGIHFDEIVNKMVKDITEKANQQVANTIASNKKRPAESGLSSQAASLTSVDFNNMDLDQIQQFWEAQKSKRVRH